MTSALPATDRSRLAKALALLSSNQPGEVQAAATAATRIVQAAGLTWQQVLKPAPVEKPLPQLGVWRQTVARLLEHRGSLRPWEVRFLTDLPGFRRLSTKQRYVLDEIASRVLGDGGAE